MQDFIRMLRDLPAIRSRVQDLLRRSAGKAVSRAKRAVAERAAAV